jgi:drug/metabolite transporter (DMT)-like permease
MSNRILAHLSILAANIIYGINYIAVKEIVPAVMHPYTLSVLRAVGALALLWASFFFIKSQKVEKKDFWRLAVAGILGVAVNQTLLIAGLNYTSSINASIIMTSNPLIVMLFSAAFLGYPVTWLKAIGVALGASGASILIMSSSSLEIGGSNMLGDMLIMANSVMYALYLIWVKPLMAKYSPFTVMRWMFLFGSGFVLAWGWAEFAAADFSAIEPAAWGAVAFVVIGATFFTYLLNVYGLSYVNPSTVSIYINLQPIIASVASVLLSRGGLDWVRALSMALVCTGVYFVSTSNNWKPAKARG